MNASTTQMTSTETAQWAHAPIDSLSPDRAVDIMVASQVQAANSVKDSNAQIVAASETIAQTIRNDGTLIYCGAGSSGLMGLADALELPGTFGIERHNIRIYLAEGVDTIARFEAESEDSTKSAARDFSRQPVGPGDTFILASASGSTPYVVEMARLAKEAGCSTIAIVANTETPLAEATDISIVCGAGPEVVAGSTRLGAATAQKVVLNCISTLTGIMLGHVYQGRMVNVVAANRKLNSRAQRIVMDIAEISAEDAQAVVRKAGGNVKLAILLAKGAQDIDQARHQLKSAKGQIGEALNKNRGPSEGI